MKNIALAIALLTFGFAASAETRYGLYVGVNAYEGERAGTLNGCVSDSTGMRLTCVRNGDWGLPNTVLLTDGSALKRTVRNEFGSLAAKAVSGDTVIYYQSSHGGSGTDKYGNPTKDACICLYDEDYSDVEFAEDLAKFADGVRVIVVLDTCHSGGMFKSLSAGSAASSASWNFAGRVNALLKKKRRTTLLSVKGESGPQVGWITAADFDQYSYDGANGGLFTSKFLTGWTTGAADADASKALSFYELFDYAQDAAYERYGDNADSWAQCLNTNLLLSVIAGVPDAEIAPTDPLQLEGRTLNAVFELENPNQTVSATGGVPPYRYELVEGFRSFATSNSAFQAIGTTHKWYADDDCKTVDLPFDFRFGDTVTRRAYVDSNGAIYFDGERSVYGASVSKFNATPGIYAYWSDLKTYELYVDSSAEAVTIRWYGSDLDYNDPINFSATLYPDGSVCLRYGSGNEHGGIVGVSLGSGQLNALVSEFDESFDGHGDVFFSPLQAPFGVKVSEDGIVGGRCSTAGNYSFVIRATDAKLNVAEAEFAMTVKENPNKRPVIDASSPTENGADASEPIVVYADAGQTFQVTAHDPEGADLSYEWTFLDDGTASNRVVGTTSQIDGDQVVATGESGVLTCRVSDGLWTNEVFATWRVAGARRWHVAASGNDANGDGTANNPFASIQKAVDAAGDWDAVDVGQGRFGPFATDKTKIFIRSGSGGLVDVTDSTVIDGGGTNRAVDLPAYESTGGCAELRGFTVTGGFAASGAGVCGGKIVNCKIVGNVSTNNGAGAASALLVNCLLVSNRVETSGEYVTGAAAYLCDAVNCTITDNELLGYDWSTVFSGYGSVGLANSIVWNNRANGVRRDYVDVPHCSSSDIGSDPRFAHPERGDYRLTAGSACIDAGDATLIAESSDLAENERVIGTSVDIGAYEGSSLGIVTRRIAATEGVQLSAKLVADLAMAPCVWQFEDSSDVEGMDLTGDGTLSWDNPVSGEYERLVQVTDDTGDYRQATVVISVWQDATSVPEDAIRVSDASELLAAFQFAETSGVSRLAIALDPGCYDVTQYDAERLSPTVVEFYGSTNDSTAVVLTGVPNGSDLPLLCDCRFVGLTLENIMLEGCELSDCRVTGLHDCDAPIIGCRLRRCAVYGNTVYGTLIGESVIDRCTVAANRLEYEWTYAVDDACTIRDSIIWNNLNAYGYVMNVYWYGTSTFENSCFLSDGIGFCQPGVYQSDPLLAAPSVGDMRLRTGSPYVGMGIGCYDGDAVTGYAVTASAVGGNVSPAVAFVEPGGQATFTAIGVRPFVGFFANGEFVSPDRTFTWSNIQADGELIAAFSNLTLTVDCESGDDDAADADPTQTFASIQAAVDSAIDGDTILVAPGTYGPVYLASSVVLTIIATEGSDNTFIDGNGSACCVYGAWKQDDPSLTMVGFSLENGYSYYGGGARCATLRRCVLRDNTAEYGGGGAYDCRLYDCLVVGNASSNDGGGLSWCTAYNCTITGNEAGDYSGGAYGGSLYNSIIWGNSDGQDYEAYDSYTECCWFDDPLFFDAENGDYSLAYDSPCRDAGDNYYAYSDTDLAGNPRIVGEAVDIGAYENDGSAAWRVTFDASGHGRIGGASSVTFGVEDGEGVEAPSVTVDFGWVFMGWSQDATNVTTNLVIEAQYESLASLDNAAAVEMEPYVGHLSLTNGATLTWRSNGGDYRVTTNASTFAADGGTALGLTSDDCYTAYELPFEFPFYGETYTTIYPNSNGAIFLGAGMRDWRYDDSVFKNNPMIAGMWRDMYSGDVYVTATDESVTFRWCKCYNSNGSSANLAITLYASGNIRVAYGSGNSLGGAIGISAGDGENYVLVSEASDALGHADDIVFARTTLPDWLELSEDGTLTGTPTEAGTYEFVVFADDEDGHTAEVPVGITVAENPNHRPVIESTTETEEVARVLVGTNAVYQVTARDPENGALTYRWYLDGELVESATDSSYSFAATDELRGTHALTCQVSDELWTINAATWTVAAIREWFVDCQNGSNNNGGLASADAFANIYMALQTASDYDIISVLPGRYTDYIHNYNYNAAHLLIRALGGREDTILAGSVYLYDGGSPADDYRDGTVLEGFTLDGCYELEYAWLRNCAVTAISAYMSYCAFVRCYVYGNCPAGSSYNNEFLQSTVVNNTVPYGADFNDGFHFEDSIAWNNRAADGVVCDDLPGGDPRFVDAANGDLRLRVGTECEGYGAYDGPLVTGLVVSVTLDGVGEVSPRTSVVSAGDTVGIVAYGYDRPFVGFTIGESDLVATNVLVLSAISNDIHVVAHFGRETFYVDAAAGDDSNDGHSPEAPLATIQQAVDLAYDGETIHVAPGTYEPFWAHNAKIQIIGDAGARRTVIDGGGSQRCAYFGNWYATNTVLVGFTLQNGYSSGEGGGSYAGTLRNCILRNNSAYYGGGSCYGCLINCLIADNSASQYGGGSASSRLYNCTVVRNSSYECNGVCSGTIYNTVLWNNVCTNYPTSINATAYNCAADFELGGVSCLLVEDPGFQNPDFDNFALSASSALIDSGDNAYVLSATDFAGQERIQNGRVDIGAYEGVLVVAPPDDVGGITASDATGAGFVRIDWNSVADADGYRVYRSESEDPATAALIGETAECFWVDATAVPHASYFYWVSALGFGGESDITSANAAHDGGMALSPLVVTSVLLPTGMIQVAYQASLTAVGGESPYTWSSSGRSYLMTRAASTWTDVVETRLNLSGDDVSVAYDLPFAFPFYGVKYDKVWISSNGTLSFGSDYRYHVPSLDAFQQNVMIAAFWKDLVQGSGAVYASVSSNAVTFTWLNNLYYSGGQTVNAAVTLRTDGSIRMSFGAGNANGAWVGVSAGDGSRYDYADFRDTSLDRAQDCVFMSNGLPPGLSLDAATGAISGTPTAVGDYSFVAMASDVHGNSALTNVAISIAENPCVVTVQPSSATAAEGEAIGVTPQLGQLLPTASYAFLVPQDAISSNAVACSAFEQGVRIAAGMQTGNAVTMELLDGSSATKHLRYAVVLRTAKDWNAGEPVAGYLDSMLSLTVTNVAPVIVRPEENDEVQAAWLDAPVITGWSVMDVPADATNGLRVTFAADSWTTYSYANQAIGCTTNRFTGFGDHTLMMTVADKDGGCATRTWNYRIDRDAYRQITFNAGEHGRVDNGQTAIRYALLGGTVTAPTVRAFNTWAFDGWDCDFSSVSNDMTVTATYRSAYPDLHVDAITVPETAVAGGTVTFAWTVGNTGYPAFNGRMTERITLLNATNTNDVRVVTNLTFVGTVERDGTVSRTCACTLPLKGLEGDWLVRIETAVSPSVREAGGENFRLAETRLHVEGVALPDIVVTEVAGPTKLRPGDTVSVTYVTANVGTTNAPTGWAEQLWLESTLDGSRRTHLVTTNVSGLAIRESRTSVMTAVIPEMVALSGDVRFRVVVDADDAVVEIDDESNNAMTSDAAVLSKRLYLTARSATVAENNASGVRFTVKRSGETDAACELTLSPTNCADLTVPAVTIPAGSTSASFLVKPIDNALVDGDRAYDISVAAEGYEGASETLLIDDDEVPSLTLSLDRTTVREGDGFITGTVTCDLAPSEPLTVYLSGASTSRCSYPSSVVIPAGETSVTFRITPVDNDTAQVAADLTLRASAGGYNSGSVSYTVEDDDVPGVTLVLSPDEVQEGGQVYATLTRCDTNQIKKAITVNLTSENLTTSDGDQLSMSSQVTIPAYTMAVRFGITAIDNGLDDGTRTNRITGAILIESCGCSGQPSSGDVIQADLVVYDNDGPALSVSVDPATMKEGVDEAGWLTISHNSTLAEDLELVLWHNGTNEIEIAETVTIPAGETSVRVPVKTLDDGVEDGGKLVSVYVDDPSGIFATATTWIQVSDQNLPDLKVDSVVPESATVVALNAFTVTAVITNIGFKARTGGVPYEVHLLSGGSATSYADSTRVAGGTVSEAIEADGSASFTVTLMAPEMPGDYRVAVVLDPDGTITELDNANNVGYSSAISAGVAYTATAQVAEETFMPGEAIEIAGVATLADGVTPAANKAVDVYVIVSGMRRKLSATTDANGAYAVTFTPTSGEAGHYTVGACYPNVGSTVAMDSFDILGLKRSSSSNVIWDIALGDEATRTVTIVNRCSVALTGLAVSFTDVPEECGFTYSFADTLPGNGSVMLSMTATANGLTDQTDYRKFYAHVTTAEGLALDFPLYFHSQSQKAQLKATPSSVSTTMAIGHARYIDVTIVNDGKGDSGKITLALPSVNWLRLATASTIDNLASGESATVTLEVAPEASDNLTLNNPLSGGKLAVNCANGSGTSVSLRFTPVSEATGRVAVDVLDNNTYVLESAPHLAGATVKVTNPYTGAVVATGTTGEDGKWTSDDIPEGKYQLTITAPNHDSYADELVIEPGLTSTVEAFVQYTLVSATWTVEKTEIEDSYDIQLLLDFETQVPAPIVKTTMPEELPTLNEGESYSFTIKLENSGVITAEKVTVVMPDIPDHTFTLSDNDVTVPAKSSVEISAVFTRPKKTQLLAKAATVTVTTTTCVYHGRTTVVYPCGKEHPEYSYVTVVRHGTCTSTSVSYITDANWFSGGSSAGSVGFSGPSRISGGSGSSGVGTGTFSNSGNGSTYTQRGCKAKLSPCAQSWLECGAQLATGWHPVAGTIVGGGLCARDFYNTTQGKTPWWRTGVNCTLTGVGAFTGPIGGEISAGVSCAFNILLDCVFMKESSAYNKTLMMSSSLGYRYNEDAILDATECVARYLEAQETQLSEWFNDEEWLESSGVELKTFLVKVDECLNTADELCAEDLVGALPPCVSEEKLSAFVSRWNDSVANWKTNGNSAEKDGLIRTSVMAATALEMAEIWEYSEQLGYTGPDDYFRTQYEIKAAEISELEEEVCASVTLKLSQTMTMTREAFDGTLTMYNGNGTTPITALKMDVSVTDEDGNECKDLFEIFANGTSGDMSEGSVLAGGLSVSAGGTGSAKIRFIPERQAAPTEPKLYKFGGTVTYVDPFSGEQATIKLTPVALTVNPSPYLKLDYFVQRDVYADDPFTPDVVEASMPAELAVLVRNEGGGDANNVTIASVQPEVVKNDKGLSVAFSLKDYTLDKTALNGATAHLGLNTVSLGTIEPNASKVAQWWLTSTIEGHFVGMSATVTPCNSWNTPDTTLVNPDVGVHKLVRSVVADLDGLPDFLTCDDDIYGMPNEIYTAAGSVLNVRHDGTLATSTALVGATVEMEVTLTPTASGWNCAYAAIPGIFRYTISSVKRSDDSVLDLRNVWITDRTFRDNKEPLIEDRLHLVDELTSNDPQTYTITLVAKPTDVPEVSAFEDVTEGEVATTVRDAVTVVFSKAIDATTFTKDDISLNHQGETVADLSGVTIESADETAMRFVIRGLSAYCNEVGRYELIVQCAGIADLSGNLGTDGKAVSWTFAAAEVPYVVSAEGVPAKPVRSLDEISLIASMAVTPESFAATRKWLNGQEVTSALAVENVGEGQVQFKISGLASLQPADGTYELSIDGTGLRSLDGAAGVNTFTCSWVRDTTAPALESVVRENGLNGLVFTAAFSEAAEASTVSLANVRLTRNGVAVALEGVTLSASDDQKRFAFAGLTGICSADGTYEFTFDATGAADEAGNASSGVKSLSWTVDTTPPAALAELAVSSEYGSVAETVMTAEGTMTLSGIAAEAGVTVEVFYKYIGGSETLLATPMVGENGAFSATLALPENGGNFSLIVRQTDAAGNCTDKEVKTYYDKLALTATLSGAPADADVAAETIALTFSDAVIAEDVTLDKFALTLDGDEVSLSGASLTPSADGKGFTLSGLAALCAKDGAYVLAFDSTAVRKQSSGLKASACDPLSWTYECPDREPPAVASIRVDGEAAHGVYTNGISSVAVTFSEAVNVETLVADGLLGQALKIQLLDADDAVTGLVRAVASDVVCSATEVTWTLPESLVGRGCARLVVDAGLIADLAGNKLVATGFATADGLQGFAFGSDALTDVDAYAMPTWYDYDGDGLGDLIVGEKTAGGQGKALVYRNVGTATEPSFAEPTALRVNGADLVIEASGCQGAQVAFADVTGDGYADLIVGHSDGKVQLYPGTATAGAYGEVQELRSGSEETFASGRAYVCPYDLDGDGAIELVIGGLDGKFRLLKYAQGGSAESWLTDADGVPLKVTAGRSSPALADVNGDGCVDILSGDTDGNVWAFLGEGGSWTATPVALCAKTGLASDRSRVGFGDVNGDGIGDLLVGRTDGSVTVALGTATESPSVAFEIWHPSVRIGGGVEVTDPSSGTYDYAYGSMATVTVLNAVRYSGATQFVCTGWSAADAEPNAGVGTQAVFRVVGDTSVNWTWQTNVLTLAEALDSTDLELATGGAGEWLPLWTPDAPDGEHSVQIGGIANKTNAWMQAVVDGPGTVTFAWKCSLASRNTKLQFFVDDVAQGAISGATDWTTNRVSVLGGGEHIVKWRLLTGRSGASAMDFAAIDGLVWTPTVPPTLAEALNTNLVWQTEGDVEWKGVARESLLDAREAWATASGLTNLATAAVWTKVYGSGILTFDWAVSCEEEYDWMELTVDGNVCTYITGDVDWNTTAIEIAGEGWHVVRWEYVKDEEDEEDLVGENAAWLDNVVWSSSGSLPDPIPDIGETPTASQILAALDGSGDSRLAASVTNGAVYNAYRDWANRVESPSGGKAGQQAVKDSPNAWLSFAIDSPKLVETLPQDGDVKIETFDQAAAGSFDFTVSVEGLSIGSEATAENLKTIFELEGGASLDSKDMSSANVSITFGAPLDGKLRFTAGPKDASKPSFFMKVKMHP